MATRFGPLLRLSVLQTVSTAGLLLCLLLAKQHLSHALLLFLGVLYVGRLALFGLASALVFLPSLVEEQGDDQEAGVRGLLKRIATFVLGALPMAWFWVEFARSQPLVSVSTFRSAALVCVVRLLVELLIVCQLPTPFIATLQGLRRGLALDLMSTADAKAQLQIALVGVRKDDLLQELLSELLACYQPMLTELDQSIRWLDQQRRDVGARQSWSREGLSEKVDYLNAEINRQNERITAASERVRNSDLVTTRKVLLRYGSTVSQELTRVNREYFAQLEARSTRRNEVVNEMRQALTTAGKSCRVRNPQASAEPGQDGTGAVASTPA